MHREHAALNIVLDERPAQLIVLGSSLEVPMIGKSLRPLIILIQNSRVELKKFELVSSFPTVSDFGSTSTNADQFSFSSGSARIAAKTDCHAKEVLLTKR